MQNINVRRILDRIIDDAEIAKKLRLFTYDDIKWALLSETRESRITEALRILVSKGILRDKSTLLGRPPEYLSGKDEKRTKDGQKGRKSNNYQIILSQSAFEKIFRVYLNDDVNKFLTSLYTGNIIKKIGFSSIYDIIKPHLEQSEFRKIASISLLDNPSNVAEYNGLAKILRRELSKADYNQSANNGEIEKEPVEVSHFLIELGEELSMSSIKSIEILSSFDPLHAVRFYRKTLHQSILKAYDELAEKTFITKGLRIFLAFDNYLSPLTAHPLNSILKILFANPFERIYEDAYLLDGEAFWVLSGRAAAIYNNFPDFLFEYLKYDYRKRENIGLFMKEMIYSWNVASTRFDMVYYYLGDIIEKKIGSGNYHLKSHGLNYDIIDLNSGKSLLNPYISSSMLVFGSVPLAFKPYQNGERIHPKMMEDPFTCLRQCNTFEGSEWRAKLWRPDILSFEDIFSDLKDKIGQTNSWMKDSTFTP